MAPSLWTLAPGRRFAVLGGVAGAACMTAGSYLYSPLPTVPPILRVLPLGALRHSTGAEGRGLALCFTGVAVLTVAWLALGVAVRRGDADVGRVNATAAAWVAPLLVAPPLFSGDGWSYAAYGYLTGHGRSPYLVTPSVLHGPIVAGVCHCWRDTPAPYGPLPLLWGGAFSRFTASPWILLGSYRLLAIGALGLLMYAVPRLARVAGRPPASASWLAISPFLLAHGVGGVHLDLLMVGLVAASLVVASTSPGLRQSLVAAIGVGLATAVKAPAVVAATGVALLALPPLASGRLRVRTTATVGAVVLGTTIVVGALGGLGVGWLRTIHVTLVLHTPLSLTYDVGRWLGRLTGEDLAPAVDLVGVVLLALLCGLILLRTRTGVPSAALTAVAVAMLLTTVLSPVTNYWYFLWCLPLLACCDLPGWGRRCVTGVVIALGLLAPLDPSLHVHPVRHLQLLSVLGALVVALAARRPGPSGDLDEPLGAEDPPGRGTRER